MEQSYNRHIYSQK